MEMKKEPCKMRLCKWKPHIKSPLKRGKYLLHKKKQTCKKIILCKLDGCIADRLSLSPLLPMWKMKPSNNLKQPKGGLELSYQSQGSCLGTCSSLYLESSASPLLYPTIVSSPDAPYYSYLTFLTHWVRRTLSLTSIFQISAFSTYSITEVGRQA